MVTSPWGQPVSKDRSLLGSWAWLLCHDSGQLLRVIPDSEHPWDWPEPLLPCHSSLFSPSVPSASLILSEVVILRSFPKKPLAHTSLSRSLFPREADIIHFSFLFSLFLPLLAICRLCTICYNTVLNIL